MCRFSSSKTEVGFDVGFEPNFVEYQATFGVSKNFVSTNELQFVTAAGSEDRIVSLAVRADDLDGVVVYRQATLAKVWLDRIAVVSILS